MPRYSVIIPVYNRPQEVEELLQSLTLQQFKNFEVVIVEDGSSIPCRAVVDSYRDKLSIQYFFKPNSGPGPSRNFGYSHARGDFFVAFDSDCIIPSGYFNAVEEALSQEPIDAWGGPDRAHENFTLLQRAMGYTMSSILTTGGIRGGKKHVGWFQPRSFNMGISRRVFELTGGFKFTRFAEDIEFSIRMRDTGLHVVLIPDAYVFHKRRTTFGQFFRQVFNFGRGRIHVGRVYPGEVKLTHWFPSLFTAGMILVPFLYLLSNWLFVAGAVGYAAYFLAILIHSFIVNRDPRVALLSVPAAFLQLSGYGWGFLKERFGSAR
jgi:glycosyltransferase involved in cell wall biosynthesis